MPNVLLELSEVSPGCKYATITLNRPAAKNALNKALSAELAQALNTARTSEDVRCVVLIGAGDCFSAGVDLKDPFFADKELMKRDKLDSPRNYIWQLQHIDVPIIAAIAGPCVTGGFEIALNCDVLVASPSAVFRDTHTVYSIVPGGGMTQLLPRMIGLQAAKYMSLTASPVDAKRALELGLVSKVVEKEVDLLPLAQKVAASIARRKPGTVRLVKEMQHRGQAYDVAGALKYELDIAAKAYEEMGRNSSQTQASLSGAFAARSKM